MKPEHVLMNTLRYALSMRRPHGSVEEGRLLASLVSPKLLDRTHIDEVGNLHIDLRSQPQHTTLFVAHVDTVHATGGPNKFTERDGMWRAIPAPPQPMVQKRSPKGKPVVNAKTREPIMVPAPGWRSSRDNVLGADDGAGVAMLAALIADQLPAYYLFTRGEECGGIGAKHVADKYRATLRQMKRAIAFDRKDVFSVITHQGWGRCASNLFAEALSDALNDHGLMYMPDDTGVYTDTAEFTDLIPECTNLSAGYYKEHTDMEHLDTRHLQALFQAARSIEWDELPVKRTPGEDFDDDDRAAEQKPGLERGETLLHVGSDGWRWSDDKDAERKEMEELAQWFSDQEKAGKDTSELNLTAEDEEVLRRIARHGLPDDDEDSPFYVNDDPTHLRTVKAN
jgi:hypothetical protein